MAAQIVCRFNKFGFCKFKETCRNHHIKELCEDSSCDILSCDYRHPQVCKFYRDFGRCKYSEYCFYAHVDKEDISEISRSLTNKINDLENKVNGKENDIIELSEKIKFLEMKEAEQKNEIYDLIEKLNQKVESLLKNIEKEKDVKFENLAIKIDTLEKQVEETIKHNFKEMSKKMENLAFEQNKVLRDTGGNVDEKVDETLNNQATGIKCDQCDFVAKTKTSLKTHKTKKHAPNLRKCTFCERTFKSKSDFKHHVISKHSTINMGNETYKCNECEFVAS